MSDLIKSDGFGLFEQLRYRDLETGILHLRDNIDSLEFKDFMLQLSLIRFHNPSQKEITILLTSNGGNAYYSFAIYSVLKHLSSQGIKVKIVVEGIAASAAAMLILQAADERIAYEESTFLLHEPRRWTTFSEESTSDLEDEMLQMKRITDALIDILSKRCKKDREEVAKLIARKEVWMSAREALEWGLIDKIIK